MPRPSTLGLIGWRRPSARVKQVNALPLKRDGILLRKRETEYQGWQGIIRRLWIGVKDGSGPSGREGGSIVVTSVSDEPGQLTQLRLTGPSTGVMTNNQQCNYYKATQSIPSGLKQLLQSITPNGCRMKITL